MQNNTSKLNILSPTTKKLIVSIFEMCIHLSLKKCLCKYKKCIEIVNIHRMNTVLLARY